MIAMGSRPGPFSTGYDVHVVELDARHEFPEAGVPAHPLAAAMAHVDN